MTIASGISTTYRVDLLRWRRWAKPGDIVRTITAPVETHQLHQEALHSGRLYLFECVMNGADFATIKSFNRSLLVIDEEVFFDLVR